MLERLLAIEDHYRELESMLGDPELLADVERWQKMNRELSQLSPIVEKVRDYRRVTKEIEDDEAVLADSDDAELKSLAAEELSSLR
ncbi:MAG: PCRF domain-containing protein, partial [Schwartzia sp.]|nr:PCRF domain-containing protein [Schwartzia sp. (in: firmicutes)]